MSDNLTPSENFQIYYVWRGLLWCIMFTVVLGFLSSLFLQYTPLSETLLPGLSTLIFFISMLLGSTIAARAAGRRGLIYGTATSISYFLLTLAFGIAVDHSIFTLAFFFKKLSLTAVSGILGGIIGVGMNS